MGAGEEGVQYNTARTLRHLALGCQAAHKKAALPAVIPLTLALQVNLPGPIVHVKSPALPVRECRHVDHSLQLHTYTNHHGAAKSQGRS